MLKREDWIDYNKAQPQKSGWYFILYVVHGISYPGGCYWTNCGHNCGFWDKPLIGDRNITHWADYQPPVGE